MRRAALVASLIVLSGCSELALPSEAAPPPAPPPAYVSLAAKYLSLALKDRAAYADFEISGLRWTDSIKGWTWLACVHFQDRGHLRSYAIFIQDNAVVDARYAVETDACETQTYTPIRSGHRRAWPADRAGAVAAVLARYAACRIASA